MSFKDMPVLLLAEASKTTFNLVVELVSLNTACMGRGLLRLGQWETRVQRGPT